MTLDELEELVHVERFRDVAGGADLVGPAARGLGRGHHHDRIGRVALAQPRREPPPIEHGHPHVEEDERGRDLVDHIQRLRTVRGGTDGETFALEEVAEHGEDLDVVVDDEDRPRRRGHRVDTGARAIGAVGPGRTIRREDDALGRGHHQFNFPSSAPGSATWNVLPWPTALSTQMRPPCSWAIPRQMYRPRPMPAYDRASTFEARWKRSNTCAWSAAGIPMPWSRTVMRISPSSRQARVSTLASPSLYLRPFSTRLSTSCSMRRRS